MRETIGRINNVQLITQCYSAQSTHVNLCNCFFDTNKLLTVMFSYFTVLQSDQWFVMFYVYGIYTHFYIYFTAKNKTGIGAILK